MGRTKANGNSDTDRLVDMTECHETLIIVRSYKRKAGASHREFVTNIDYIDNRGEPMRKTAVAAD